MASTRFNLVAWSASVLVAIACPSQDAAAVAWSPESQHRSEQARQLVRSPQSLDQLLNWLTGADDELRLRAATTASSFGQHAEQLIQPLARELESQDQRLRYWSCWSLGRLMPHSLPVLLEAGEHADPRVRRVARQTLQRSLDARRSVLPLPDLDVGGCWTTYCWQPQGVETAINEFLNREESLERLCSFLDDPVPENRILALMVLAKLQRATPTGLELLRAATRDADPGVRLWAEHVQDRIAPPPWIVLRRLRESVLAEEREQRLTSTDLPSLVEMIDQAPQYSPPEQEYGRFSVLPEGPDLRYEAACQMARLHLPALLARAEAGDTEAQRILDRAQAAVEWHVRVLILVATEEFPTGPAATLLADVGPAAIPQVAAAFLVSTWDFRGGTETCVRDVLGPVLARLGQRALPALCFGLENLQDLANSNALDLAKLGSNATPALPGILALWRDWSRPWLVENVCQGIGPAAVPYLIEALGDEHAIVRVRVCRGLGAIGASSDEVLRALTDRLDDDEPGVRSTAAGAIEALTQRGH